jgi:hypothetical protein
LVRLSINDCFLLCILFYLFSDYRKQLQEKCNPLLHVLSPRSHTVSNTVYILWLKKPQTINLYVVLHYACLCLSQLNLCSV